MVRPFRSSAWILASFSIQVLFRYSAVGAIVIRAEPPSVPRSSTVTCSILKAVRSSFRVFHHERVIGLTLNVNERSMVVLGRAVSQPSTFVCAAQVRGTMRSVSVDATKAQMHPRAITGVAWRMIGMPAARRAVVSPSRVRRDHASPGARAQATGRASCIAVGIFRISSRPTNESGQRSRRSCSRMA